MSLTDSSRRTPAERIARLARTIRRAQRELELLSRAHPEALGSAGVAQILAGEEGARPEVRGASGIGTALLDAIPAHVAILDATGTIVAVNRAWRRFAAENSLADSRAAPGGNYLAVCRGAAGGDAPEAEAAELGIRAVLEGRREEFQIEYPCHGPGARRWFRMMVAPDAAGGAVVLHLDITDRMEAELQRERLLRDLGERIKELRALYEVAGLLRDDRLPAGELLAGVACALPAGFQFPRLLEARVSVGSLSAATPGFAASPWRLRVPIPAVNAAPGEIEVVYSAPPPVEGGPVFLPEESDLLQSIADLLRAHFERRHDQHALAESEARLRAIFENEPECVKIVAPDGTLLDMNPAGLRMVEAARAEEVLGCCIFDLVHPEDRERFTELHERVVAGGSGQVGYRIVGLRGTMRSMETHSAPLPAAGGGPPSVLSVTRDVTEARLLEAQLLRAQRMESIGTLAGGIAHDLNNILTPILMTAGFLRRAVSEAAREKLVSTIEASTRRGAELVRQILTFARGAEGQRLVIDVVRVARDVERLLADTLPKNIVVSLTSAPGTWPVEADPTQIHQVLMNLCVNARDAMSPGGGHLHIRVENANVDEALAARHPPAKPGPHVVLEVEDTGHGMPPEIMALIFEPFFTTKDVGQGTGLGLSTSDIIARSHGGFIEVASTPGSGTVFRVHIPASTGHGAATVAEPVEAEAPPGRGELVLVVDDEEAIRGLVRTALESRGYRTLLAADGEEALALYRAHREEIALVISDLAMPVQDGAAAIVSLRKLDPGLRILVASGTPIAGALPADLPGPPPRPLSKPYTAGQLLDAVRELLAHSPSSPPSTPGPGARRAGETDAGPQAGPSPL